MNFSLSFETQIIRPHLPRHPLFCVNLTPCTSFYYYIYIETSLYFLVQPYPPLLLHELLGGKMAPFYLYIPSVRDLVKHSVQNQQRNKSMNECSFLDIEDDPNLLWKKNLLNSKKATILEKVQSYVCYYGKILQSISLYSTSQFLFNEDSTVLEIHRWT